MAFTPQDIETLKQAKAQGKTKEQALAILAQNRSTSTVDTQSTQAEPISNKITEAVGLGGATGVFGRMANTLSAKYPNSPLSKLIGKTEGQKEVERVTGVPLEKSLETFVENPTGKEMLGATLQTAAIPLGAAITGGSSLAGQIAAGAGTGYLYDVGKDLVEGKSATETFTPGLGTITGAAAPAAIAGVSSLARGAKPIIEKTSTAITKTIPESQTVQGTKQVATDIAERVPRFLSRRSEDIAEAAAKSQKIKTSSPAVAQAIKVDLPEKYINTVTQADPATKSAYKKVLDIADETPKTVGVKKNPTIVGGELAAKQYEIIDKQRKTIGKAIGEQVKKLGLDKAKVDMRVGLSQVDDVLEQQGIKPGLDGRLTFAGKYTPAERARIQELYTLARESGDVLTPTQVRDMDVLFSKLQRETRMEGLGDIRVDVNGDNMSMFRVFRDIYANQLENLSPELRKLNSQYRNISTLIDDIEDSIIKTPNFNITKSANEAEFAKVNLRRIFGESQSSPVYEAIADEMDAISRQLGYTDAKPKDVAAFAQEIRELYPESVPRAGFAGGIKSGVIDLLTSATEAGKADVIDQRKSLRALLEATEEASQ